MTRAATALGREGRGLAQDEPVRVKQVGQLVPLA